MDTIYHGEACVTSPLRASIIRPLPSTRDLTLLVVASVVAFPSATAVAQEKGNLNGVVSTAESKPLGQARIHIVGTEYLAVSDSDGHFRIASLPVGRQTVEIKLLGYTNATLPVLIESDKEAVLLVTLSAAPVTLATVKVTSDTIILPEMRGFMERKGRGSGTFLTRDEIDHMPVRTFTDIIRRVAGMQLDAHNSPFGTTYSVESSRMHGVNGAKACNVLYYLNGVAFPMMGNLEINSFVRPDDIAAIEVYNGASQIPTQFNSTVNDSRCGVVVIWTRIRSSGLTSN